ncbi:indole-3-glycerol phosphate synthase TrpC [Archaeoglobus sp.]
MFRLSKSIRLTKENGKNAVIAEIKVHSPKHGDLLRGRDPIDILRAYERAGVCGISYITEPNHFRGSFKFLKELCKLTDLPVLRKDFITNKFEIEKTAEVEASAVLLITRILKDRTAEFVDFAKEHGLDTVVEVHTPQELEIAVETKTTIVGINNRDIGKLEKDDGNVSLTEKLAPLIPNKFVKLSESGIRSLDDLKRALRFADAVLIGTAFMLAEDTEGFVRCFVHA